MSVHLHTTIPRKTDEILEELARTYGTKSRVIEKALETMLRVEKVGSCEDCVIKARVEEQNKLRETLDLISIRRDVLERLLKVTIGDQTFDDFLKEQKKEAKNIIELLKSSTSWKAPTNFRDFLTTIEEIKNLTRLFDITSHSELDNTLILRPKVFTRIPELVAHQLSVILEGIEAPFDLRIMGNDIVIKMIRGDVYFAKKKDYEHLLFEQTQRKLSAIKPSLFKDNLVLVGPAFMKWAEKHLDEPVADLGMVIEDIRAVLKPQELAENPKEFVKALLSAGVKMNWLSNFKTSEENEDILKISFQATNPSMARFAVVTFSLALSTRGWKLVDYLTEYDNGSMMIKFVGEAEKDLLDKLAETNLYRVVSDQFLDVIPVPREIFDSFAAKVFEGDRKKFEDIYNNMGARIANAIRMLAKGDSEKIQLLSRDFIVKNLSQVQPDAEVRFVDKEHFTMVFKKINPLVISSQRFLIESMLRALGYEVSTTAFQNLLNFKTKMIEKPVLEPVPRSAVMQTLVDAMSASSAKEAFQQVKPTLDELFPLDYPWTIREVGERLIDMYRELGIEVEIEYFEGGFTLKYRTCPYYKLVRKGEKAWLCNFRKKAIEYIMSRVTRGGKGRIKMIKSLLKNEHPCEYAIFLTKFLEE
jgi:predicted CopG family antitoxin